TEESVNTLQDDVAVIAGATNAFGFRPDDHGNDASTATALARVASHLSGSGIIETLGDADYFSFFTGAGQISLSVNVAGVGANLDAKLELRSAAGALIASADPSGSLGATIPTTVA